MGKKKRDGGALLKGRYWSLLSLTRTCEGFSFGRRTLLCFAEMRLIETPPSSYRALAATLQDEGGG